MSGLNHGKTAYPCILFSTLSREFLYIKDRAIRGTQKIDSCFGLYLKHFTFSERSLKKKARRCLLVH